jgi:hypothetical protein
MQSRDIAQNAPRYGPVAEVQLAPEGHRLNPTQGRIRIYVCEDSP